jgi:uncharacterized protein with gpF-like domain
MYENLESLVDFINQALNKNQNINHQNNYINQNIKSDHNQLSESQKNYSEIIPNKEKVDNNNIEINETNIKDIFTMIDFHYSKKDYYSIITKLEKIQDLNIPIDSKYKIIGIDAFSKLVTSTQNFDIKMLTQRLLRSRSIAL